MHMDNISTREHEWLCYSIFKNLRYTSYKHYDFHLKYSQAGWQVGKDGPQKDYKPNSYFLLFLKNANCDKTKRASKNILGIITMAKTNHRSTKSRQNSLGNYYVCGSVFVLWEMGHGPYPSVNLQCGGEITHKYANIL